MGLDQYLNADVYVSRYDYTTDGINPKFAELVQELGITNYDENGFSGMTIQVPMAYWRKCNQIHQWFVDNVQDGEDNCGTYFVSRDNLAELIDLCKQVLADNSKADELLPSQAGFFFGSTDYDEWYFKDLEDTVKQLTRCLESPYDYFEYTSSW